MTKIPELNHEDWRKIKDTEGDYINREGDVVRIFPVKRMSTYQPNTEMVNLKTTTGYRRRTVAILIREAFANG